MVTKIKLECQNCGKKFDRVLAEHNRNQSKGRRIACSRKCQGKLVANNFGDKAINISKWCKDNNYVRQSDELSLFRVFLHRIKWRDNKGKPNIDLTPEYLKELWEKQGGLCALTKIPMILKHFKETGSATPYQASLDRVDNSLPYQQGNVRFVCLIINYARNGFSDQQVTEFIKNAKNNYNSLF